MERFEKRNIALSGGTRTLLLDGPLTEEDRRLPSKTDVIAGVDLGGTSLRALVLDGRNQILSVEKTPIEQDVSAARLIKDIAACVETSVSAAGLSWSKVRAVSVGAPGAVDPEHGIVYKAPNLGWENVRLARKLGALLSVPVLVENDVNAGTIGEYVLGAGRGTHNMIGVFVGTGIGGGLVLGGELHEGYRGAAGEIGHMIIERNGPRCGCGRRGCVEALASRTAMEREVRQAIRRGAVSVVTQIMKERKRTRMTSSIISRALGKNDPLMIQVMKRAQFYLGILVANLVNTLDPEAVVIGGGIAERLGERFVAPIRATAQEYFLRQDGRERVKILHGVLGDNAGALGAAVLARRRLGLD
jgi:glucokinase